MRGDSNSVLVDRFYTMLYFSLAAQMPRPSGNLHPYSTGNMYRNFKATKLSNGWKIEMSSGVPYSAYAMGYTSSGGKRTPRSDLERRNFAVIDTCINQVCKCFTGFKGGLFLNGNRLY